MAEFGRELSDPVERWTDIGEVALEVRLLLLAKRLQSICPVAAPVILEIRNECVSRLIRDRPVRLKILLQFFQKRQQNVHDLAVMQMEMQQMDKEAEIAERIEEVKLEAADSQAAWKGLEASYREAAKRWSTGDSQWIVIVDVVRGLMRPALTLGLVMMVGAIYFTIDGSDEANIKERVIATILRLMG